MLFFLRFFEAGRELFEISERLGRGHDCLGALVRVDGVVQFDESLLAQFRQLAMHRGGRAREGQRHGFRDRQHMAGMPGGGQGFEQPLFGSVELGYGGQGLNSLRKVQEAEVGIYELFFCHENARQAFLVVGFKLDKLCRPS
jgi:hypothetical protein